MKRQELRSQSSGWVPCRSSLSITLQVRTWGMMTRTWRPSQELGWIWGEGGSVCRKGSRWPTSHCWAPGWPRKPLNGGAGDVQYKHTHCTPNFAHSKYYKYIRRRAILKHTQFCTFQVRQIIQHVQQVTCNINTCRCLAGCIAHPILYIS